MTLTNPIKPSDLVVHDGAVYHLALKPEQLADNLLLVGDPERVPMISRKYFSSVTTDVYHRGLRSHTGIVTDSGQRVSIVTTGMGTPSTEIVLGELTALAEIDLIRRLPHECPRRLKMIRVGTSGGLQPADTTPLGTLIISALAIGLDNTGLFYESNQTQDPADRELEEQLELLINNNLAIGSRAKNRIKPYVSRADPAMVAALQQACIELGFEYRLGATVSNSGFFANQGRDIFRVRASLPNIDRLLAEVQLTENLKIENMEMESSFIFHFCSALGYSAASICPTVANRSSDTFIEDSLIAVQHAAAAALRAHQLIR